jgi:hypothetical protein
MIEISLSNVPRKNPGFHMTRKHYQHHIFSVYFYLFGYSLSITRMDYPGNIKFYRYQNYT